MKVRVHLAPTEWVVVDDAGYNDDRVVGRGATRAEAVADFLRQVEQEDYCGGDGGDHVWVNCTNIGGERDEQIDVVICCKCESTFHDSPQCPECGGVGGHYPHCGIEPTYGNWTI